MAKLLNREAPDAVTIIQWEGEFGEIHDVTGKVSDSLRPV